MALPDADQARALWVAATGPGSLRRTVDGALVVEARVAATTPATLAALRRAGARALHVALTTPVVTLAVPPARLPAVAAVGGVVSAREVLSPVTNVVCPTGIPSEGVAQLRADLARARFPSDTGAGVTVGILSDSFNFLGGASTDVAAGELPGATNPCGHASPVSVLADDAATDDADEGRAMAQIVHDVAPGAALSFATAVTGEQDFADSIRALAVAGAEVIVDDITYYDEPMFQDGVIAKAISDVTAGGVSYFTAAGNFNARGPGAASYDAPSFRPAPCPDTITDMLGYDDATCHDFDTTSGVDTAQRLGFNGSVRLILGWNEPVYGITTDLDLCLLDPTDHAVVACSNDDNVGTSQKAFEFLAGSHYGQLDLVVVRVAGTSTPRLKWIGIQSVVTNEYSSSTGQDTVGPTAFGHNVSRDAVSVAAVPFNFDRDPEDFSSRGPATTCWGPVVGAAPAAALPGGCEASTIDLAASDGTANSFFGYLDGATWRFFGTSAAAPHAAAVAALVRAKAPELSPADVLKVMRDAARPVGLWGIDAVGSGLTDVYGSLCAVHTSVDTADCVPPTITVTPPPGATNGWYRTDSVLVAVSATDPSNVADLRCSGGDLGEVAGLGTGAAHATVDVRLLLGTTEIVCTATDGAGAIGRGPGSTPPVPVRVDTFPPEVRWTPDLDTCSSRDVASGACRGVLTATFRANDYWGSGLADPSKAAFSVTATGLGAEVTVPSGPVSDLAGNVALGVDAGPFAIAAPQIPSVAVTSPLLPISLASTVLVRWAATVPATTPPTTIATYRLQRALKASSGALGAYVDLGARTSTSFTHLLTRGSSACFRVRATASSGLISPWSAVRCTTLPLDDRGLATSRTGWSRRSAPTAYFRTVTTSTTVGATLTSPALRGSHLVLVVTKQPGGGTLGVYVRGRRVAIVPTTARRGTSHAIVTLKVAPAGAKVVLRVVSRGTRGVSVDGLAALP